MLATPTSIADSDISIYVINLARSRNRYANFVYNYDSSGFPQSVKRIEAVNGRELDLNKYVVSSAIQEIRHAENYQYRQQHYQLTRGGVGCYLSHLKTYNQFLKRSNAKYAVIFEDDAYLPPNCYQQFQHQIQFLPKDWDIALLACTCRYCLPENQMWVKVKRFFGLHAYLINRRSASKLLKLLISHGKMDQQIDSLFSDYCEENQLSVYCARPQITYIDHRFETTIQVPVKLELGVDVNGKPIETKEDKSWDMESQLENE